MNHIIKGLRAGVAAVMAVLTVPVAGQDLLANQAPIDKKMRAVDSVAIQRLIGNEQLNNPAFSLYPDWSNQYVHRYANVQLPDEFKIDLRGFVMPTTSRKITSRYGYRASFRKQHKGLDVKVYIGDTIRSAFDGKIRIVAFEGRGYGKYVVIRHPNGLETVYGHLSKQLVRENEIVKAGEPIGLGGNTGRSTGSHLHFETRLLGEAIDPAKLFDFEAQDVTGDFYVFRSNGQGRVLAAHSGNEGNAAALDAAAQEEAKAAESRQFQAKKRTRPQSQMHKVRSGETLSSIAKKHGTTINKLCRLNGIKRTTILRLGQVLRCS